MAHGSEGIISSDTIELLKEVKCINDFLEKTSKVGTSVMSIDWLQSQINSMESKVLAKCEVTPGITALMGVVRPLHAILI